VKILVVGTEHPWVKQALAEWCLAGDIELQDFAGTSRELGILIFPIPPDYILFPHFSERIPRQVYEHYECIGFHMTDLPDGRGGTPLQNLIVAGETETVVTAFRVTEEMDAGPIYLQRPVSLYGSAEEIYLRMSRLSLDMATEIITKRLAPKPQRAMLPTDRLFKRRKPAQSVLPATASLDQVYDHLRMLDADGYPPAFIDWGNLRLEFSQATRYTDRVEARVLIRKRQDA
tara:strand:+ start:400 stop:1092 length:693 start_codon:yes stop_codon:yes gene_type:complete